MRNQRESTKSKTITRDHVGKVVQHLLIQCADFNDVRWRCDQVPSLQDLCKTVKPEVILDFLKAAALYRLF